MPVIFLYWSNRIKDNDFIDTILIGVVQPNVLQRDKIDNPDEYEILRSLIDLSNKEDASFLIWPESSVPILLQYNPEIIELIVDNLPKESEILIGNITFQADKFSNSALLIDQDKKIKSFSVLSNAEFLSEGPAIDDLEFHDSLIKESRFPLVYF